jgi:pilus assembly protein CpaF
MAGMEIPIKAIREYIESAIDLVVHVERLTDGRRKVTSICEIVGFKGDMIELKEIFAFNKKGLTSKGEVDGAFVLYNRIPKVYDKLKSRGINSIKDIFEKINQ